MSAAAIRIPHLRWYVLALLFAATAISYIDRQTLSVVAPVLRDELGISNFGYARLVFSFLLTYTVMQAVAGWLIDRLGTRRGFAVMMAWWSAAAMLHGLGRGIQSLSFFRLLLGAGEAGSWAACVRAVAEWFPVRERGFANGIWGAGSSVGMIVAAPAVAWLTLAFGWRMAFVLTGLVGFLWLAVWLLLYRLPVAHPAITPGELAHIQGESAAAGPPEAISYRQLVRTRSTWALTLARIFSDPIAWFYNAWVPEFLRRTAGFSMAQIGLYGWIPPFTMTVGIVLGGFVSDWLCRRGWSAIPARKAVMLTGVIVMLAGAVAAFEVPVAVALGSISLAVLGFGLWAPNMMSLCADAFPRHMVGSITGLSGVGAGLGGMVYTLYTGWALDRFGYAPIFVTSSLLPLVAFAILHALLETPYGVPAAPRVGDTAVEGSPAR